MLFKGILVKLIVGNMLLILIYNLRKFSSNFSSYPWIMGGKTDKKIFVSFAASLFWLVLRYMNILFGYLKQIIQLCYKIPLIILNR